MALRLDGPYWYVEGISNQKQQNKLYFPKVHMDESPR